MQTLEREALETFTKGSKTFSLAARFFSRETMVHSAHVYLWCRHCDDVFDEQDGDEHTLKKLERDTLNVWNNPSSVTEAPFRALLKVKTSTDIPSVYPLELLKGMEMDLKGQVYQTIHDLKLYCYRVASTVGLMMCHVMGLFQVSALKEAAELGMAMQLTNIARDVKTDWEMGRLYLPVEWLREVNLEQSNYFHPLHRTKLFSVVDKLIDESELLYTSGLRGVRHLPLVSALAILIAGKMYREIGREIKRKGERALEARTVVPLWRKLILILAATFELSRELPSRFFNRKKTITINETWVYA